MYMLKSVGDITSPCGKPSVTNILTVFVLSISKLLFLRNAVIHVTPCSGVLASISFVTIVFALTLLYAFSKSRNIAPKLFLLLFLLYTSFTSNLIYTVRFFLKPMDLGDNMCFDSICLFSLISTAEFTFLGARL